MSMRRSLPRIALTLVLAAIAGWVVLHRDQINLATLDAWLAWLGPWAPIGHMMLFALGTVAFVPGVVFSLAGGALFGPFWGSLWNLAGATLGATLAFLVARYIAGEWVARNAGGLLKRLIDGVDAEGWRFVAFVRLVPLFPFSLSNYVLGLTRIPLHHYVIATLVCMVPGAVAYTWLGHAGRSALSGEANAVRNSLLALGLLALLAGAAPRAHACALRELAVVLPSLVLPLHRCPHRCEDKSRAARRSRSARTQDCCAVERTCGFAGSTRSDEFGCVRSIASGLARLSLKKPSGSGTPKIGYSNPHLCAAKTTTGYA
jgi:uncharacterized membrane protein YdjX (TVP38/TMEM64 family)